MAWNPKIRLLTNGEDHYFLLREAYLFAQRDSDDTVTKTGAVIVGPDFSKILAWGANHFPSGLNPTSEKIADKDWKYKHIIHAETAAIFDAARRGSATQGAIMYMPWIPCTPCATAIVDAGIKKLVGHKELIMKTPERWQNSTNYALSVLERGGVESLMCEGEIRGVEHLFNGEVWKP